MANITLYLVLAFFISFTRGITKCDKRSSCSCMGDKGLVDLTPLAKTGGIKYKDVQSSSGDMFSWNPCNQFTEGDCKNVAACQIQAGPPKAYFSLGTQDTAKFEVKGGALKLSYNADTFFDVGSGPLRFLRTSIITLVCDPGEEGKFSAAGESPSAPGNYMMTLNSKYACEQTGGGPVITVDLSISVGSIMVILFFVLLLVYGVAGASVQKFGRKAEGREILPNYVFWTSLPGLIRDGVLFAVRCGKPGKKYDQI